MPVCTIGFVVLIILVIFVLTACGTPAVPTALPTTPALTATPAPTWTPIPTPTPTPIPPARLTIDWPASVSPLNPAPLAVSLMPPAGTSVNATITATVMDPEAQIYRTFALTDRQGVRYSAPEGLMLPFQPLPGYLWLIVHVDADLPIVGEPALSFVPEPVPVRDLAEILPAAVTLQVPQAFAEAVAQGDVVAGGRVWIYGRGEVGLWWAPGPAEVLTVSNALVLLEATHAADGRFDAPPALSGGSAREGSRSAGIRSFRRSGPVAQGAGTLLGDPGRRTIRCTSCGSGRSDPTRSRRYTPRWRRRSVSLNQWSKDVAEDRGPQSEPSDY